MGTPEFAVPALELLVQNDCKILFGEEILSFTRNNKNGKEQTPKFKIF
jgi:methionyl-tRNA formyltransferase